MVRNKFKGWLKRYLPAELVGTITALLAASIAHGFDQTAIFTAYIGSFGEAIGFYSSVVIQHVLLFKKRHKKDSIPFSLSDFIRIILAILVEFGFAGLVDGLLLRPFFMYLFPILLNDFTLGILVGKIAGDITFYLLVILAYETKQYLRIKK